jgi:hypothetical protein
MLVVGANPLPKSSPGRAHRATRFAGHVKKIILVGLVPNPRFAYVRRMTENWRAINLANWESRVPVHTGPGGYDRTSFDDPAHLSTVVRYDLPRLGRLDGLDVLHLQCQSAPTPCPWPG